jgi:hypothetical protein
MTLVPAVTPVTMPLELPTVAVPFAADHVPPDTVLLNVMFEPTHTAVGPDNVPDVGNAMTVTICVALATPQTLLIV